MARPSEKDALAALWVATFAIYAFSLDGAPAYWDTGEMQTVPYILGIPHPTGFPTYVLIGWLFTHLVPLATVAWRAALLSAVSGSLAAVALARLALSLGVRVWIACGGALAFALGHVVWVRATRAEVHVLALAFAVIALERFVRWSLDANRRALIFGAGAIGLGIATHPLDAMLLPALLVLALSRARSLHTGTVLTACAAFAGAIALYAYLPLRSASVVAHRTDPTLALGVPPGRPFWDTNDPRTLSGFLREVSGSEFHVSGTLNHLFDLRTTGSALPPYLMLLAGQVTPVALLFALAALRFAPRRPLLSVALGLAFAVPLAFALNYTIEADRERYYMLSFALMWVVAVSTMERLLHDWPAMRAPLAILLACVIGSELWTDRAMFGKRDSGASEVIATARAITPDGSILIAPWLYATPLAYGAYVERSLGTRVVETAWYGEDARFVPQWVARRPVYVVGQVWGDVPGYHLLDLHTSPPLFRVVKN